ncbi:MULTISPECIES: SEC-C metal-binding domain-containing protein [Sphingobium]|uniref:SEC-C domain-containing protein n=1 Tax=Sphingobium soli TaxID=1591116 RepID=A0ABS8H2D9_9SPHN|nr:SEC-C domain-containing protein [Sphingobium soli]
MTDYSYRASPPRERGAKIGRNERCRCQSGRKYKHCHRQ